MIWKLINGIFFILIFGRGYCQVNPKINEDNYQKAVFIERLTRFVRFDSICPAPSDSFYLTFLGNKIPDIQLTEIFDTLKISDKPVRLKQTDRVKEIFPCNLLFVCRDQGKAFPAIEKMLDKRCILVLGDTPGFVDKGVVINMLYIDNQIRYEISLKAAQKYHLQIDRMFLMNAHWVDKL